MRLVPDTLGSAEDLSLEFLGSGPRSTCTGRGRQRGRREALGFPAWALINDPANGRHALALVKAMEKLAQVARTKPGNAKDSCTELAERLGRAAPRLPADLPGTGQGAPSWPRRTRKSAGTCFVAARQAEAVHGLTVDEDRLRDVHLEFAFAGALTAKAVTEYAREVAGDGDRRPSRTPSSGRSRFAGSPADCRRTAMADDLKRLAKAAGLNPDTEAESVIGELIGLSGRHQIHEGFWKSCRPAAGAAGPA